DGRVGGAAVCGHGRRRRRPDEQLADTALQAAHGPVAERGALHARRGTAHAPRRRDLRGPVLPVPGMGLRARTRIPALLHPALGPGAGARLPVATLHPPQAQFDSSFGAEVPANGPFAAGNARTSTQPTGSLDLVNPSPFPRRVRLQANFNSAEGFSTNLV